MMNRRAFVGSTAAAVIGGGFGTVTTGGAMAAARPGVDPILKEIERQAKAASKAMAKPTPDAAARFSSVLMSLAAYVEANDLDRAAKDALRQEIRGKGRDTLIDEWLSFDYRADALARGFDVAPAAIAVDRAGIDKALTIIQEKGVSAGLRQAAQFVEQNASRLSQMSRVQLSPSQICNNQQLLNIIMHGEWGALCLMLPEFCAIGLLSVTMWELYMWWSGC